MKDAGDIVKSFCGRFYPNCEECPLQIKDKGCYDALNMVCDILNIPRFQFGTPIAKSENHNIPKWCKVGTWVTDITGRIGKIVSICNESIEYVVYEQERENHFYRRYIHLKPVRFRPPTFSEAKTLIGKQVNVATENGYNGFHLITSVALSSKDGSLLINHRNYFDFAKNVTMDGHPIGVPIIDVEAMEEQK